jgi:hypothetical protein
MSSECFIQNFVDLGKSKYSSYFGLAVNATNTSAINLSGGGDSSKRVAKLFNQGKSEVS